MILNDIFTTQRWENKISYVFGCILVLLITFVSFNEKITSFIVGLTWQSAISIFALLAVITYVSFRFRQRIIHFIKWSFNND